MHITCSQSQNTYLEVSKEDIEFIEYDTDLEVRAQDIDIDVTFLRKEKEQFIIFHNGEPDYKEFRKELVRKIMVEINPTKNKKYKISEPEDFMNKVKKLLKETEPDYSVYDYNKSPNLEKESRNLKNVSHRLFPC